MNCYCYLFLHLEERNKLSNALANGCGLKLKQRAQPPNVRKFVIDILTFDGFLAAQINILKPRRLLTPSTPRGYLKQHDGRGQGLLASLPRYRKHSREAHPDRNSRSTRN